MLTVAIFVSEDVALKSPVFSLTANTKSFPLVDVPLYEESVNFPSALFTFIVSVVDTVL